ncbi:hypothetical protein CLHUN_12810 [Ruminiclostridium hungatei]|uniref:Uncharacterized protein n=1 Tax=Ruminiclostridium hungatei TaxID=48256 RepID=A0A1V4SME1_RUMHU|nr:leucine-rich repeat domain-containing protein [Ruminiclostridium hungatei]OPX45049.1 hypothetical protein CLHUN_12810 [Ruminiclostridium hungatei]
MPIRNGRNGDSNNTITDLSALRNLEHLEVLYLDDMGVSDITPIGKFVRLKRQCHKGYCLHFRTVRSGKSQP